MAETAKVIGLNHEQAIKTAEEILRLEAALKKMKDDLKDYVERNSEVVAGGKVWGFSESLTLKLTTEQKREVATLLTMQGIDCWDVLKISTTDLQKVGWTSEDMKNVGTVSYTRRFGTKSI